MLDQQSTEEVLKEALDWLASRGRGNRHPVTLDLISEVTEISTSTLKRWAAGRRAEGQEEAERRLISLYHQSRIWYLRAAPFILGVWSCADPDDDARHHQDYFSEITFRPEPKQARVIRCELELDLDFVSFTLFVTGAHRNHVGLSHNPDSEEPGTPTLHFGVTTRHPDDRRSKLELRRGSRVPFFIKYRV